MRLYSLCGMTAITDGGATYKAGADGGFDFPEDVGTRQHSFAVAGKPLWEDQIERQRRLMAEEAARRADPATLLAAVEAIHSLAATAAPGVAPEPAQQSAKARAAKTSPKA